MDSVSRCERRISGQDHRDPSGPHSVCAAHAGQGPTRLEDHRGPQTPDMAPEDHGDLVRIAAVIGVGRKSHMRCSAPTVILVDAGELANWATGSDLGSAGRQRMAITITRFGQDPGIQATSGCLNNDDRGPHRSSPRALEGWVVNLLRACANRVVPITSEMAEVMAPLNSRDFLRQWVGCGGREGGGAGRWSP